MPSSPIPVEQRVANKIMPVPFSGCWWWTGDLDANGYGLIYFWANGRSKSKLAHRVVYELHCDPIPEGMELDHLCRTPCCVNPDHLEPVTHAENMARGIHATKTHCKHGHPLSGDNLKRRPGRPNARECRTCSQIRMQRLLAQRPDYHTRAARQTRAMERHT